MTQYVKLGVTAEALYDERYVEVASRRFVESLGERVDLDKAVVLVVKPDGSDGVEMKALFDFTPDKPLERLLASAVKHVGLPA